MSIKSFHITISLLLTGFLLSHSAFAHSFAIVAHKQNPEVKMTAATVRQLFLGTLTAWPDGSAVIVADYNAGYPLREKFSKEWLGMSTSRVYMSWLKVSLAGLGTPPKIFRDEDTSLKFVSENIFAITYVSMDLKLPSGLKVISVVKE